MKARYHQGISTVVLVVISVVAVAIIGGGIAIITTTIGKNGTSGVPTITTPLVAEKTREVCLPSEELCFDVPESWTDEHDSSSAGYGDSKLESVQIISKDKKARLNIYESSMSVGGHCQDPNPPSIEAKASAPIKSNLFDRDVADKSTTLYKIAYRRLNAKSFTPLIVNYVYGPDYNYGDTDTKKGFTPNKLTTLTKCAATFTESSNIIVQTINHKYSAFGMSESSFSLVINYLDKADYSTADAALNNTSINTALKIIKSAHYGATTKEKKE